MKNIFLKKEKRKKIGSRIKINGATLPAWETGPLRDRLCDLFDGLLRGLPFVHFPLAHQKLPLISNPCWGHPGHHQ